MTPGAPNPLAMTAQAYARASAASGLPGGREALNRYARFYRLGPAGLKAPGPSAGPAPVHRRLVSDSPEGQVVKFTQLVPRRLGAEPTPGDAAVRLAVSGGDDRVETESVLIPMVGRTRGRCYTLCVSSQVGCAMGCGFCQTAQMGLLRSLTVEEIVGQWYAARHLIDRPDPEAPITNVVFMGMGEPMDNLAAVVGAIEVLTDSRGPALAMSRITVSTVGRIDGIRALGRHVHRPGWHRLALAVSLNAPTDEIRSGLMPVNRAMPLARLREALAEWPIYGGSHQCIEYVLIPGVNDRHEHADAVASFVLGAEHRPAGGEPRYDGPRLTAMVNVIPYNPRDGSPWPAPDEAVVDAFMERLKSRGVYVKRRRTKGRDTMAACGQLGNPALRRRPARV
ncbi:MAG: 23S rRNA (adenine(2503)-C(2))-methyltransferase RlmN [Phycisphaeraceae bacterium]|nr:23S rRNA (adenine(2503)-C(2))-methyltransferase RlmN [Phycisphaeraceae bacterium]